MFAFLINSTSSENIIFHLNTSVRWCSISCQIWFHETLWDVSINFLMVYTTTLPSAWSWLHQTVLSLVWLIKTNNFVSSPNCIYMETPVNLNIWQLITWEWIFLKSFIVKVHWWGELTLCCPIRVKILIILKFSILLPFLK